MVSYVLYIYTFENDKVLTISWSVETFISIEGTEYKDEVRLPKDYSVIIRIRWVSIFVVFVGTLNDEFTASTKTNYKIYSFPTEITSQRISKTPTINEIWPPWN